MNFKALLRASSAALVIAGLPACQKKTPEATDPREAAPQQAPTTKAALPGIVEKTSFEEVTSQLDPNGWLYTYLSSEQAIAEIKKQATEIQTLLLGDPAHSENKKEDLQSSLSLATSILANSGLEDISGLGFSSIAIEPGYYQNRSVVHHHAGKGKGFIWNLHGGRTNGLEVTQSLPAHTALGVRTNLSFVQIWEEVKRVVAANPKLKTEFDAKLAEFEALAGHKIDHLLANIGPTYTLVLALAPDKTSEIELGPKQKFTIQEPSLAITLEVQDPALLQKLEESLASLPFLIPADEGDLKLRRVGMPLPVEFLKPVIAWKGNQLIIASNEALIREMFAVAEGTTPGLLANPEFKKAIEGFPADATTFYVATPAFYKAIGQIAQIDDTMKANSSAVEKHFIQQWIAASYDYKKMVVGVQARTEKGAFSIQRSEAGPARITQLLFGLPAYFGNQGFMKGRTTAKLDLTTGDLNVIEASIDQWAIENNKASGEQPTTSDLTPYVKKGTPLHEILIAKPNSTTVILIEGASPLILPKVGGQLTVPHDWLGTHIIPDDKNQRYLPEGPKGGMLEESQ